MIGPLRRFKNRSRYPRLNLAYDFVMDALFILFVDVVLRIFYLVVAVLARLVPTHDVPEDVHSYLPVEVTRGLVTIADGVSLLAFSVVAIGTLVRLIKVVFWSNEENSSEQETDG
jgi:hypothetical protein